MKFKFSFIITIALLLTCTSVRRTRAADEDTPAEQTIAAGESVAVSVCLESGDITVRGWERKEVRARTTSGGQLELRRADGANENAPATRVEVLISEDAEIKPRPGQCNPTGDLELDVPRGSIVQLKGRSGDLDVSGVAQLRAETLSGSIELRDITRAVEVTTANGDISLKHAKGRAHLRSISGQIDVSDAGPAEAGDDLWAKTTSGDITLTEVRHARVEAGTTAGSIDLTGALARGGFYDLKTTQGDVTLTIPADSSFFINAKVFYGGDITTDFPIRLVSGANNTGSETDKNKPKGSVLSGGNLTGVYGASDKPDTTLNLASFSGSVRLRKAVTEEKR
jgi:DUF4097 and DUF4098 domain-containing protein YvlB